MSGKRCPICGGENGCTAGEKVPCWCALEEFPQGIFDLVPPESLRKDCICKSCLHKFKEELEAQGR
nr:cysteine-rich CWC family protein [Bacillus sp. FJAT-27225]